MVQTIIHAKHIDIWSNVREKFCITVDTTVENAIIVHVEEGKTIKFVEVGSDLYLLQNPTNITNKKLANNRF